MTFVVNNPDVIDARTLPELLDRHAAERGDRLAIEYRQRRLRYVDLQAQARRVAASLQRDGLRQGERVAFLGRNPDLYFSLLFGCAFAGVVFAPLNWRLAPAELDQVIDDLEPALVFVDRDFLGAYEACEASSEPRAVRYSIDETGNSDIEAWLATDAIVPKPVTISAEDTAVILYSSGTTGRAKGVELTHRCFLAPRKAELQLGDWMRWNEPEPKLFAGMPLFHIGCLSATMMAFYRSAAVYLMDAADPDAILDAIGQKKLTRGLLVPTLINIMLSSPRLSQCDLSSLEQIYYGGSPIAPTTLERALSAFGCEFAQGYGMSEVAGTCVFLPPQDHDPAQPQRLRSIGRSGPTANLDVRDAAGAPLADGEIGEIWVRSVGLMKGYWRKPGEDLKQIVDGWYRSGDAGYRDEQGYFYLTDRFKDMIVSGAENIYPAEIESALAAHPAVMESAVIGIPHARWGEAVHAVVVLRIGMSANVDEIVAFLRTRIAGYKLPRSIEFSGALPRNAFGKVVKYQLRDPHWAGLERRIGG